MTVERDVCRIQDRFGRGPYRPGMPVLWVDDDGPVNPPWWREIGLSMHDAHSRMDDGHHWGCGFVSLQQMHAWFTAKEMRALSRLGYFLVWLRPDVILAETPRQVVFGCKAPLAQAAPRISLVSRLAA